MLAYKSLSISAFSLLIVLRSSSSFACAACSFAQHRCHLRQVQQTASVHTSFCEASVSSCSRVLLATLRCSCGLLDRCLSNIACCVGLYLDLAPHQHVVCRITLLKAGLDTHASSCRLATASNPDILVSVADDKCPGEFR